MTRHGIALRVTPGIKREFYDLLPEGWEIVENVEENPVPINELRFVSFLKGERFVSGKEMRRRAKEMEAAPGLRQGKRFLEEQEKAPRELRRRYDLPLTGALVQAPDCLEYVPCLVWRVDQWKLGFRRLSGGYYSSDRLLSRRYDTRA